MMDWKWSWPNSGTIPVCLEGCKELQETSATKAGVPAKIPARCLLDISVKHYSHNSLLSNVFLTCQHLQYYLDSFAAAVLSTDAHI
jgi:hypothetical protein